MFATIVQRITNHNASGIVLLGYLINSTSTLFLMVLLIIQNVLKWRSVLQSEETELFHLMSLACSFPPLIPQAVWDRQESLHSKQRIKLLLFDLSTISSSLRNRSLLTVSNAANTSPYPVSFSSASPMPCKRWPPLSKDLRLIESWGYKISQRSSVCPNACPCPESLSTKGMVLQPCKKLIMKLMPVVLPALSFVPTAPWLLILPHVPTIALHRVSTWPTALPT